MPRSRSFKTLVQDLVRKDKKFAEALAREGADAMSGGDVDTGKTILRGYLQKRAGVRLHVSK